MRRKRLWVAAAAAVALIAAAGGFVAYRERAANQQKAAAAAAAPKPVVEPEAILSGRIQARVTIAVPVPIDGVLSALHAAPGDEVYEGQLIAEIRSEGLESAQQHAELELERAQTRVQTLEASISAARLEASRANADLMRSQGEFERASREYTRQKLLIAEGATPRVTFEKAEKQFKALETESQTLAIVSRNADERVSTLTRELDSARKLLDNRTQDLEAAKGRVTAGQVLSPATGIVASSQGAVGEAVHPTTQDLFRIATDTSTLDVVVEPSPAQSALIKPGTAALVGHADIPGEQLAGKVTTVEGGKVTVEFANPSTLVKPGQTAQVRIALK